MADSRYYPTVAIIAFVDGVDGTITGVYIGQKYLKAHCHTPKSALC
jgi:hypothetical protein